MVVISTGAIEITSSTGSEAATSASWLVATTTTSVAAAATINVSLIATATSTVAAASLGSLLHSFFLLSRVFSEPSIIVKNSFVEAPLFSQVGDSELMLLAGVANILLEG